MNCRLLTISIPLIALAMLLVSMGQKAQATEVIPPDFNTMVHRAEVIFRGKVTDVRSAWAGEGSERHITSYVTFDVLKTLKGKAATPYVLQMLGGTVGDQTMEVDGVPKFKVGDETLLFVEHNGTQFFPVVGIMHGYFRVQADAATGANIVLKYNGQPLQNTSEIDVAHQRAVATSGTAKEAALAHGAPMRISDFQAEIQRKVATP